MTGFFIAIDKLYHPYIKTAQKGRKATIMRNWKEWLKAAAIRAVRTFAQTAVATITVGQAFVDIDWLKVLSVSGVAAVLSLLTSLAGLPEVPNEGAPVELPEDKEV